MHSLELALEAIDFQKDHPLATALDSGVADLRKGNFKTVGGFIRHPLVDTIKKITGLDVSLRLGTGSGGSVLVPDIDINCPVINEWRRGISKTGEDADNLFRVQDIIDGTVDMERVCVSGDYTKVPVTITIGSSMLSPNNPYSLSTREVSAILAHELGHSFYYLWALGNALGTNYILQDAARRLIGAKDETTRLLIVDNINKETGIDTLSTEALKKVKSVDQCNVLLLDGAIRKQRSDLGMDPYNARSFEKMADNFSSRMGYTREVVTGLDKILRVEGSKAYDSALYFALTQITSWTIGTLAFLTIKPFAVLALLAFFGTDPLYSAYDTPRRRLEAMANDARAMLKDRNISAEVSKKTLEDIKEISAIVDKMVDRKSMFHLLQQALRPNIRRGTRNMELQLLLEDMANNKLYESAAALRQ